MHLNERAEQVGRWIDLAACGRLRRPGRRRGVARAALLRWPRPLADVALFQVREIAYDPWNATHIALRLQDEGATMVEFRQGFRSMAAPTRELEKLIVSKKLAHGGNPVTRWMAANVAVAQDSARNLKPANDKSTERIEGIVALIMAIGPALVEAEEPHVEYQLLVF
jgi:phage terminase large subunit-like protein